MAATAPAAGAQPGQEPTGCVIDACICEYTACDFGNIVTLCKGEGKCLCYGDKFCCIPGMEPLLVGMAPKDQLEDGQMCKLGIHCMECYLEPPKVLCQFDQYFLCIRQAGALPFGGAVPKPICVCYGLQCFPNAGCCKPPPTPAAMPSNKTAPSAAAPATMVR